MEPLLAFANVLLGLAIIAMILLQAHRGTVPLLSARTVFYFGLVIFQVNSAVTCFAFRDYWETNVGDPVRAGVIFTTCLVLFIVIFEVVYRTGWLSFNVPRRLATRFAPPADTTLLALSIASGTLAIVLRFVLIYIPVFNVLFGLLATPFATASAALFCWVWSKRVTNPALWVFGAFILGSAFLVSSYQSVSRRDLLSVATGCLWGAYHGHFRYVSWRRSIVPLATIAGAGMVLLAAFTATRSQADMQRSQSERNSLLAKADLKSGLTDLFGGQYCAPISLWLIETRPDQYPYDTLHTLRYAVTNVIPRDYYPGDKPVALGQTMVPEAGLNVGREGFSVGPGLMGHIFNDNPWLALPLYAIVLGVILHIFDRLPRLQPGNPFVVIPVGAALGELVAISRGEMGLYIFRTVMGCMATYVGLFALVWLLRLFGWQYRPATLSETLDGHDSGLADEEYAEQPA